ncbi:hypothetical protein RRSWK_06630 [Rhodopirellula sp. SWK7]|nr:hypothetical protein RRSWK_06630 [Rhodopirellula sp. SWK7]
MQRQSRTLVPDRLSIWCRCSSDQPLGIKIPQSDNGSDVRAAAIVQPCQNVLPPLRTIAWLSAV